MNDKAMTPAQSAEMTAFGTFDSLVDAVEGSEQQVRAAMSEIADGDVQYMNFAQAGKEGKLSPFMFGEDDTEVHPDSTWVIDYTTFQWGWHGFPRGEGGKMIKGARPDAVWSPWTDGWPDMPAATEMNYEYQRAFKFRAICLDSPDPDDVGALVEVKDWRKMSKGLKEIGQELRRRVQEAKLAKTNGDMELFGTLMTNLHPKVRFQFQLRVPTGNGEQNKAIYNHVGWHGVIELPAKPELPDDDSDNLEEALEREEKPAASRRRGRRR